MRKKQAPQERQPQIQWLYSFIWWLLGGWLVYYTYQTGAGDWQRFYRPATLSGYATAPGVANPLYVLFLFYPLSWLPVKVGGAVLAALNVACLYACHRLTGVNRWLILLNLPALIVITFGQLDGLVALGAALGYAHRRNGLALGAVLLLLGLKPQIGGVLAAIYLVQALIENWRSALIALGVVGTTILASFAIFGLWLPVWVAKLTQAAIDGGGEFDAASANIGLFPYGLVLLALVLLLCRRPPALLAATMLAMPYAGFHSLVVALAFPLSPLVYFATWLPAVLPPWSAWAAPLAVLAVGKRNSPEKRIS